MASPLRIPDGVAALGAVPGETDGERTQRIALVVGVLVGLSLSALFGTAALVAGDHVMAVGNAAAVLYLGALVAWFAATQRLQPFVLAVALLLVVLPCVVLAASPNVTENGGLFVGALGPILAAVFASRRAALALLVLHVTATFATVIGFASPTPLPAVTPELEVGLAQAANGTLVVTFLVVLIAYLVRARREAAAALELEHQRSEALLLNVLPASIAARLKQAPTGIADQFDDATILFADLVGFTPLASELSPVALVALLDELFGRFDDLADRYGLEKIKTIGDAYLVVGGLPTPRPDHAEAVARMALELIETVRAFRAESGHAIDVRVGINSGSVVGGVIGRKKFTYDLWGDAVNVASRMESHGLPGRVHVGPGAHARLAHAFELEARGPTVVKGKGEMATWWLIGPLPPDARSLRCPSRGLHFSRGVRWRPGRSRSPRWFRRRHAPCSTKPRRPAG